MYSIVNLILIKLEPFLLIIYINYQSVRVTIIAPISLKPVIILYTTFRLNYVFKLISEFYKMKYPLNNLL